MITHVAIISDHNNMVYALATPNRHHHVIYEIYKETGKQVVGKEGFLDYLGNFLDRKTAKMYAEQNSQIKEGCGKHDDLFSEDLW